MTAPTTRETADHIGEANEKVTADHAELARLAEAAVAHLAGPNLNADGFGLQIWGDSLKGDDTHVLDVRGWGYLTGGGSGALGLSEDDGIAAQRAIQAYVVAAWNSVPALLSEIAALRGERRNIVSHATMGATDGEGLSCNDVSVAITRLRNEMHARATQAERQRDEALDAALKLSAAISWTDYPFIDNNTSREEMISRLGFMQKDAEQPRAFLANQGADQ